MWTRPALVTRGPKAELVAEATPPGGEPVLARTKSGGRAGGATVLASSTSSAAPAPAPPPTIAAARPESDPALARKRALALGARALGAGPASTAAYLRGFALYGGLAFLVGAAPWSLPAVYLAWAAVALPLRVHEFVTTRRAAFLLEFCYVS